MEILITERTYNTPLLGMGWMKTYKLTFGRIQFAENSRSEREKVFTRFPYPFENERHRDNHSTQTGTLLNQTKSETGTTTSSRRCWTRIRKTNWNLTLREVKRCKEDCFFISPVLITVNRAKAEALISTEKKHIIMTEPIQRMEGFTTRPKNKKFETRSCRFCNAPNWTPIHKCPALDANCNKCDKKGHNTKACRQKFNNPEPEKD